MEGSAAAVGGDAGQQSNGAGAEQANGDLHGLVAALEALAPMHEQTREALQSVIGGGEPTAVNNGAYDGMPGGFGGDLGGDGLATELAQLAATDAHVQQQVQAAVEPIARQLDEQRMEQAAHALVSENESWGDPTYSREMFDLASRYAEQLGDFPGLDRNPQFWRLISMAHAGAEAVNAERNADPVQTARLEGGGAAAVSGDTSAPGYFDRSENTGRLPF